MNESSSQTLDRVRASTSPEILRDIETRIEQSIRYYSTQGPDAITRRIEELEREWDMERTLGTNAATLALTAAVLGLTQSRKWFLLDCLVTGFLLQHAIQGWCPPVPVMRRFGVRTRSEIDCEKFALKALRGDFKHVPEPTTAVEPVSARQVLESVNA